MPDQRSRAALKVLENSEQVSLRHRILAHRAVMRNRGDRTALGSDASPPSHDPFTRQKMLLFEMRYEVPSGPSASRSAFHPALAAAEPGLG